LRARLTVGCIYSYRNIVWLILSTLALTACGEEDMLFGHNAAGQLQVRIEFLQPFELPVSVFPGISGFATGELGLHSTILDDSANDFFQLSSAADFRFILLSKDPGMEVWNDHGSAFMTNGESFFIGQAPFDTHPVWNLVTWAPGASYSLTLKLIDLNSIYTDSEGFTLSFTPTPSEGPYQLLISGGSTGVRLSWPTNAVGWVLESSSQIETTNSWSLVTKTATINDTNYSLELPVVTGPQFFRLHAH
jgi:hypothetical protein